MDKAIESSANAMFDAYIRQNYDLYNTGHKAFVDAGGTESEYHRDYCRILDSVAKKVIQFSEQVA